MTKQQLVGRVLANKELPEKYDNHKYQSRMAKTARIKMKGKDKPHYNV